VVPQRGPSRETATRDAVDSLILGLVALSHAMVVGEVRTNHNSRVVRWTARLVVWSRQEEGDVDFREEESDVDFREC